MWETNNIKKYSNYGWKKMWRGIQKIITVRDKLIYKAQHKTFEREIFKHFNKVGKNLIVKLPVSIGYPQNISIGENCYIREGVVLYSEDDESKMIIGDNVFIGKNVQIDFTGGINIEENTEISEGVLIFSHDHEHSDFRKKIKYELHIGKHVRFGARSIVLAKTSSIGNNSVIGAGAVVTKEVPDNVMVGGNPAKIIKQI
jgi:acetyltransferase-like isoleucine patch superfamily enzyme